MDLSMPDMDGWAASRLIRRNALSQAPIIVLSANASGFADDKERNLQVCNDYLPKPVHLQRLLDRLQHHLQLTWLRRAQDAPTPAPSPRVLPSRMDLEEL